MYILVSLHPALRSYSRQPFPSTLDTRPAPPPAPPPFLPLSVKSLPSYIPLPSTQVLLVHLHDLLRLSLAAPRARLGSLPCTASDPHRDKISDLRARPGQPQPLHHPVAMAMVVAVGVTVAVAVPVCEAVRVRVRVAVL